MPSGIRRTSLRQSRRIEVFAMKRGVFVAEFARSSQPMVLGPGARLGPYEIQSAIGAGGMGEIYRATDTNLARQVAVKILPDAFAQDPERVARFEREAKTLASLSHPNIAIIHGVEKSQGAYALVMELVEGEDLARRIARGPFQSMTPCRSRDRSLTRWKPLMTRASSIAI
jgi:serine/threonine protein kinase